MSHFIAQSVHHDLGQVTPITSLRRGFPYMVLGSSDPLMVADRLVWLSCGRAWCSVHTDEGIFTTT